MGTLVRAELAAALLDAGRLDEAAGLTSGVMDLEAELPDLLITAGRLEAAAGTTESQRLYDAAATRFRAEAAEPALLRDCPSMLVWRVARRIARTNPTDALELYDRALSERAEERDPASERKMIVDRAELLARVGRKEEAAECFKEAGTRYAATGSSRALHLYEQAHELVPSSAEYSWLLAEERRFRAHAGMGAPDRILLQSSWDLVTQGLRIRRPEPPEAWVLVSAALSDWWLNRNVHATVLIERALLLDPEFSRAAGNLADILRRHCIGSHRACTRWPPSGQRRR